MIIEHKEILEKLTDIDRPDLLESSAVENNNRLLRHLKRLNPKVAVEIGTYRGISTVVLASVCETVYTFDVLYQPDAKVVFDLFGLNGKVKYKYQSSLADPKTMTAQDYTEYSWLYGPQIRKLIANIDFNLGFIDGCHGVYSEVEKDFEAVKKCGTVLFHDYRDDFPETIKFCDSIGCEPLGEFALWQK